MVTQALFVRLEARSDTVETEDGTLSFAIFDAFPDDAARQAHLSGEVAAGLATGGA